MQPLWHDIAAGTSNSYNPRGMRHLSIQQVVHDLQGEAQDAPPARSCRGGLRLAPLGLCLASRSGLQGLLLPRLSRRVGRGPRQRLAAPKMAV